MDSPARKPSNVIAFRGKPPTAPDDRAAEALLFVPWHRKPKVMPLTIALLISLAVHGAVLLWLPGWIIDTPERQASARLIHARLVPITVTAAPAPMVEPPTAPKPKPPAARPSAKPGRPLAPQPDKADAGQARSSPAQIAVASPPNAPPQPAPAVAPEKRLAGNTPPAPAAEPPSKINAEFPIAYLNAPPPEYPLSARKQGQQGLVLVRVLVNRAGQVEQVKLAKSSGVAALDEAAMNAVQRWTFVPAQRGTSPVAAWVEIPVRFRLEKEE